MPDLALPDWATDVEDFLAVVGEGVTLNVLERQNPENVRGASILFDDASTNEITGLELCGLHESHGHN